MTDKRKVTKNDGMFQKGDKRINRKGRIYNTKKQQIHQAFDAHRDELIAKTLELAQTGDQAMLKLAMSYCSPPVQHRLIRIDYPEGADLRAKIEHINVCVANETVSPVEGKAVIESLTAQYNINVIEILAKENRELLEKLKLTSSIGKK